MASATILTDALAAMALFASFSVLLYLTYNYQGPVSTVHALSYHGAPHVHELASAQSWRITTPRLWGSVQRLRITAQAWARTDAGDRSAETRPAVLQRLP